MSGHEIDSITKEYLKNWREDQNLRRYDLLEEALEKLANKVVNLANKLEEHMKEPDSHNPAMMGKKK